MLSILFSTNHGPEVVFVATTEMNQLDCTSEHEHITSPGDLITINNNSVGQDFSALSITHHVSAVDDPGAPV